MGGTNLSLFVLQQLPVISPATFLKPNPWYRQNQTHEDSVLIEVLELVYTAWDLEPFAQDCGFGGSPFRWNEERRVLLRCELDAAFFHLYLPAEADGSWRMARRSDGCPYDETPEQLAELKRHFPTPRDAVAYIMDTFPIVNRKDEEKYNGDYRTKRVILEIYDAMQKSIRTGQPYQTRLDPPPGDAACRHPKLQLGILAYGSLIKDPGTEIEPTIKLRLKTVTSFPVEYGRYSGKTRGGAPTVVKHDKGGPVAAELLILDDGISFEEARNMLWRRERRKEGSGETYVEDQSPNSVLVREVTDNPCVERILYTDFRPEGKIAMPDAVALAKAAIKSVKAADKGKDGITYLIDNLEAGIDTPRTREYVTEILRITKTETLQEALKAAQD
jgi:hypothetical protein